MSDREIFHARAVEILRREIPEELEWLRWRELPAMHWRGDRAPVAAVIPRGWLVMAAARGVPEPDVELSRQAALFDRNSATALGSWLLGAWIEHDTAAPGLTGLGGPELTPERRAELRALAERAAAMAARFGRGGSDPEERYRQLLKQEANRPQPSAMPFQGLLGVVAVCADATVAAVVSRYLETWHGERPEPCVALLRMATWIGGAEVSELLRAARRRRAGWHAEVDRLLAARADDQRRWQ